MSSPTEVHDPKEKAREYFEDVLKRLDSQEQLISLLGSDACVFRVPESLRALQPEHYDPQMVGLGPYNHLRPKLQEMDRVKLDAMCRLLLGIKTLQVDRLTSDLPSEFKSLTDKFETLDREAQVRSCYSGRLELDIKNLACIMAIDSAFLAYLLFYYSICIDRQMTLSLQSLQHYIVVPVGSKLAERAIMRDVMRLENQVPFFCVVEMLTLTCGSSNNDLVKEFPRITLRFCEFLSPIKCPNLKVSDVLVHKHLLGLLYFMIVRPDEDRGDFGTVGSSQAHDETFAAHHHKKNSHESWIDVERELGTSEIASARHHGQRHFAWKHIWSKVEKIFKFCKANMDESNFKVEKIYKCCKDNMNKSNFKGHLPFLPSQSNRGPGKEQNPGPSSQQVTADILLPTASRLADAGAKFAKAETIKDIRFDKTKARLYLPVLHVDEDTEVIIRNLVAYEATTVRKSLKFAGYIELMSGLIDTVEDVKLLKKREILISRTSDGTVATIFNTKMFIYSPGDEEIDQMTRELNAFCEKSSKLWKLGNIFVYGFWRTLAFLLIITYLLLVALQSFCSALDCSRLYN